MTEQTTLVVQVDSLENFRRTLEARVRYLGETLNLPAAKVLDQLDWTQNQILVAAPGTGKNVLIVPMALAAGFNQVIMVQPSIIMAARQAQTYDALYHPIVGGCQSSQYDERGLIESVTTGKFIAMAQDSSSVLYQPQTLLVIDELQRLLEDDELVEFWVGHLATQGVRILGMSATIDPVGLDGVFDAVIHEIEGEMYPLKIEQMVGGIDDAEYHLEMAVRQWHIEGRTGIVFAPTIKLVHKLAKVAADIRGVKAVTVTGGQSIETKQAEIAKYAESDTTLVVIATPGVMDSGITIPGATRGVLVDNRLTVIENQYGQNELVRGENGINHIWQMLRRLGRQPRPEGDPDQWIILTGRNREHDLNMSTVTFDTVKGSVARHANVDKLMLTAVSLDVVFDRIDDYMQSDVEQAREDASLQTLLREGAIVVVIEAECGYRVTELGQAILDLPFGYEQSRLVALAPDWMQPYLCVLFSFGSLHSYANHESDGQMALRDRSSEPLSKVLLGIDYLTAQHDSRQRLLADQEGMLFGRLEAMESQSRLAFRALGIRADALDTSEVMYQWPAMLDYLVQGGYYQVFPMKKGRRGHMTMIKDVDHEDRQYMISNDQLRWLGEYVLVVGRPLWFESRRGNPCAFVDDASLVGSQKYTDQVADQVSVWGWQRVEISDGGGRINGVWYSLGRQSQDVPDGWYWVRLDRWRRQIKLEVMWPAE